MRSANIRYLVVLLAVSIIVTPALAGSISGTVKFDGPVPKLRPVKMEEAPAAQAVAKAPVVGSPDEPPAESGTKPVNTDGGLSLAPAGSDVLRPDERANVEAVEVDISALALEPGGGEILHDKEKRSVEKAQVDTSHLEILPPR